MLSTKSSHCIMTANNPCRDFRLPAGSQMHVRFHLPLHSELKPAEFVSCDLCQVTPINFVSDSRNELSTIHFHKLPCFALTVLGLASLSNDTKVE